MYKKILLPIIFLFSFYTTHSQVHLTPLVGYSVLQMRNYDNSNKFNWHVNNDEFSDYNFIFGLKLNQKINERYSLSFIGTYSKKKMDIDRECCDPGPYHSYFHFSNWNFISRLNFNIIKNLSTGLGLKYGSMWIKSNGEFDSGFYNHQYGANLNVSYRIKNIDINLNYNRGLGYVKKNLDFIKPLKPLFGINLMVGYRFKVLNTWKRTKDVNCPTL